MRSWLLPLAGGVHLLLVVLSAGARGRRRPRRPGSAWIPLSRLVLLVASLLFLGCAFYAVGYLELRRDRGNRVMVPCLLVFLSALTLAAMSRHLGLLWLAVETTTLASAPLIYYNRNRLSIEATWKYLLICSVGIALAMLGMLFVAYAALRGGGAGQPAARRPAGRRAAPLPSLAAMPASSSCWSASAPRWGWRRCIPGSPMPTARRRGWSARCWPAG